MYVHTITLEYISVIYIYISYIIYIYIYICIIFFFISYIIYNTSYSMSVCLFCLSFCLFVYVGLYLCMHYMYYMRLLFVCMYVMQSGAYIRQWCPELKDFPDKYISPSLSFCSCLSILPLALRVLFPDQYMTVNNTFLCILTCMAE